MQKSPYHHGDLKNALIQAGIDIVAAEGVYGLTLRKTARLAGVSYNAPYAHFADKQSLIAAIALEGHVKIHAMIEKVIVQYPDEPLKQLRQPRVGIRPIWIGLPSPLQDHIFGVDRKRKELSFLCGGFPAQPSASPKNSRGLPGSWDFLLQGTTRKLLAVNAWSLIHGLVSLVIEGQVPSKIRNLSP